MKTPIVIVNFKTYEQATGHSAEELADAIQEAEHITGKSVAVAVQNTDIYRIFHHVEIPVFAEHIDPAGLGGFTGKDTYFALKQNGAKGALVNHSEDRVPEKVIRELVNVCRENKLVSIVCVKDDDEAEKLALLAPDMIAVEPPELIGGDISVSTANPQLIAKTVRKVKNINPDIKVLCGAGVKTKEDVIIARNQGADGILIASGVTKASNPKEKMIELLSGL